jgi:hypothetical protein
MADSRTIDLHEDQAEAAGEVFDERGLAVSGRRDEQEHAHAIRALGVSGCANLLGEIAADERQIRGVDQPVSDKAGKHLRLELGEPQASSRRIAPGTLQCDDTLKQR